MNLPCSRRLARSHGIRSSAAMRRFGQPLLSFSRIIQPVLQRLRSLHSLAWNFQFYSCITVLIVCGGSVRYFLGYIVYHRCFGVYFLQRSRSNEKKETTAMNTIMVIMRGNHEMSTLVYIVVLLPSLQPHTSSSRAFVKIFTFLRTPFNSSIGRTIFSISLIL